MKSFKVHYLTDFRINYLVSICPLPKMKRAGPNGAGFFVGPPLDCANFSGAFCIFDDKNNNKGRIMNKRISNRLAAILVCLSIPTLVWAQHDADASPFNNNFDPQIHAQSAIFHNHEFDGASYSIPTRQSMNSYEMDVRGTIT